MKGFQGLAAVGLGFMLLTACGGGSGSGKGAIAPENDSGRRGRHGQVISKAAAVNFDKGLQAFQTNDKASSWNDSSCKSTADLFNSASTEQEDAGGKPLAVAVYNAGLAYQRCGKDDEAQKQFQNALNIDSGFHRAKAQLALYKYKQSGDIDEAIRELDQIIRDAKFQNVEALVSLAALQMQRGGNTSGPGCDDDLSCAKLNLQRALAIDDGFMPAANQLSVYYMEQAKAKASAKKKGSSRGGRRGDALVVAGSETLDVNKQQLDLAALVASQALQKNPSYAPLHNTVGLIMVQLKNYNGAVKAFGRASQLDPKFFEAHMNYGAVNLSFRGFGEAEQAYRKALALRPKNYEAHLGLALAIRGQINDSNFDKAVKEAQEHLDQCKKLAPERPEAYYNEAILTQEFRAKRGNAVPMLEKAAKQYREFIQKAGSDDVYAEAVKRSKDRSQDIEDTVKFIKEGEEAKKNAPPPPPPAEDKKDDKKDDKKEDKAGAAAKDDAKKK